MVSGIKFFGFSGSGPTSFDEYPLMPGFSLFVVEILSVGPAFAVIDILLAVGSAKLGIDAFEPRRALRLDIDECFFI